MLPDKPRRRPADEIGTITLNNRPILVLQQSKEDVMHRFVRGIGMAIVIAGSAAMAQHNPVSVADKKPGLIREFYRGAWPMWEFFPLKFPDRFDTDTIVSNFVIHRQPDPQWYGYVFRGYLSIPGDGVYTFFFTADDRSALFVANTQIATSEFAVGRKSGTINLRKGDHPIMVQYTQTGGEMALIVEYEGPQVSLKQIPDDALFHSPGARTALRPAYNNGSEPAQSIPALLSGQAATDQVFDLRGRMMAAPGTVSGMQPHIIVPAQRSGARISGCLHGER
jgi:hypothetical protein